jgi:hypothetical protein
VYDKKYEQFVKDGSVEPQWDPAASPPIEVFLPQTVITDTTPEALGHLMTKNPNGLMLYNTELAGWWGGMDRYARGAERPMWLQTYDGGAYTINRRLHPIPYRIERLTVAALGGAQPSKVSGLLDGDDDGLIHRFLVSWPDPVPSIGDHTVKIDKASMLKALRRIYMLEMNTDMTGVRYPPEVKLSPEAVTLFREFQR